MVDITQRQWDDFMNTLNKTAGSMGDVARNLDQNSITSQKRARTLKDLGRAEEEQTNFIKRNVNALRDETNTRHSLSKELKEAAKAGTLLGTTIGMFLNWGNKTVNTYREMTEVGQTFSGSMIEMSRAAAQAGLPLDKFASALRDNSKVVAQLGASGKGSFGDLAKRVRMASEANGLYGMSVEQITEYTGAYLEIQRISGQLNKKNDAQTVKSVNELALSVSTMTQITGEARKEILERTKSALSDVQVAATMNQNAQRGMSMYNEALQKAVTELAAQPGKAGQMLSKGMADTFSHFGQSYLTEVGQTFIKAGVGGATDIMNEAARRIQAGEDETTVNMEMVSRLKKLLTSPEALESLKIQAMSNGANKQAALDVLEFAGNLKEYTRADIAKAKKDAKDKDAMTAAFSSFSSVFDRVKGFFIDGFLKPFSEIFRDPKSIEQWQKTFNDLQPVLEEMGQRFGTFVKDIFTPANIKNLAFGLEKAIDITGQIVKGLIYFGTWIMKISSVLNGFYSMFDKKNNGLAGALTGATIIGLGILAKGLLGGIGGLLGKMFKRWMGVDRVQIVAKSVNVLGKSLGGGGGGSAGDVASDMIGDAIDNETSGKKKGGKAPKEPRVRGRGKFGRGVKNAWKNRKALGGLMKKLPGAAFRSLKARPTSLASAGVKGLVGGGLGLVAGVATDMATEAVLDKLGVKGDDKNAITDITSLAATGATIGSIIPGVGTLTGAIVGGALGGGIAIAKNWRTVKKWATNFFGGIGKSLTGIWDWLGKAEWLQPVLKVAAMMTPIGFASMVVPKVVGMFNQKGKDNAGTLGDPNPAPYAAQAPKKAGFFASLFAPKVAAGIKTPGSPKVEVPKTASPAADTRKQNDDTKELIRAVKAQTDAINAQTAMMARLLREQNALARRGVAAQESQ